MSENLNEVEKLEIRPFTKFCMSIGAVPSSYLAGLSIEEQLLWLCSYLENEVIPTVNNNGESVEELQTLFTQLQSYVNNYFTNLDVQDEINDKLDAMALNGTLATIINQEIFGEINDDITSLENSISTINNTTLPNLQTALQANIDGLKRNAIYIGNSYTEGTGSSDGHTGLYALTRNMFENAYKYVTSGGGFLTDVNFEDLLDNAIADNTFDNDSITDIIVIGAWGESRSINSLGRATFKSNMNTALNSFMNKVKNNFTNILNVKYVWAESRNEHTNTHDSVDNGWKNMFDVHNIMKDLVPQNGMQYCGWIGFNILMQSGFFSSDNIHPSTNGYTKLAALLKEAYNGNLTYSSYYQYFNTTNTIRTGSYVRGFISLYPDKGFITINRIYIPAGNTPDVNATIKLIDFSGVNYAIPQSYGYNLALGSIKIDTEVTFDSTNEVIFRLTLKSENNESYIEGLAVNKKTIPTNIDNAPTSQTLFLVPFTDR